MIIAQDAEREEQLLDDMIRDPLRPQIAVITREMVYRH